MKKILLSLFSLWFPFEWKILYDNLFVDALKIWSINLALLFSIILVSPILVRDYTNFFPTLFQFYFVDGFRFHVVIYLFCILIATERYER